MLEIEVVGRDDLSRIIERKPVSNHDCSLLDLIKRECPKYNESCIPNLSAFVDGVSFQYSDWSIVSLKNSRKLKIVIEAGGIEVSTVMAIISVVMAVASAIYAVFAMNKLSSKAQQEQRQGSSIYDVNAQGNQVNLNNVIPENFGYFKRFPDYLADRHVFYRNNTMFVDLILCQGVGSYQRANDYSDVYLGETPISELDGCQIRVYEPGETITPENSIENKSWYCYYSSTQVTQSGHTLKGVRTEIDQSSQINPKVNFLDKTFSGKYYTITNVVAAGCAGVQTQTIYTEHKLDLGWENGAYFTISGSNGTRLIGSADSDTVEIDQTDPTLTNVEIELSSNFVNNNETYHKDWFRQHNEYLDEEQQLVVESGDQIRILIKKKTTISYSRQGGTSGPQTFTESNTNQIVSLCELMNVAYTQTADGETALIQVQTAEIDPVNYPPAPSAPGGAFDIQTSYDCEILVLQPIPADYPFSDNGMYRIETHDTSTGVYEVVRVNSSYAVIENWVEFWGQGVDNESLSFTLDSSSSSLSGAYAGPYRACPVGATSNIFEYDIRFPQGLGYLQDDGSFRDLTVEIEIGYRLAGSNDAWTTETKTFTNNTNDELAYTYELVVPTAGNYEFRMRNLSEDQDSTRALCECKWVGLKSVIATKDQYDDVTVMICRFKGTETLSEISSNQISTYWTRKLPNISNGSVIEPTRQIAPVVKYICNNSKYAGIVDQLSLNEFNAFWNSKNLTLDGTIDQSSTLLDVLRDALNVGFSSPVVINNKLSFVRLHEQAENEPLTQIFSPQNMTKSPTITFSLPRDDETQEIVLEYTSPETYKTETLFCSLDENGEKVISSYPNSDKQEKIRAWGVTSAAQAQATGMRRLRYLKNTRVTYTIETELDALNCQFNDLVGLFLDEEFSNITGRVLSSDGTTITVDMEIPEAYATGTVYIRQTDGKPASYVFTRVNSHQLTIDSALTWNADFGVSIEYPFFAIGELVKCWVTEIQPSDKKCTVKLINYNAEVFTDDL